MILVRFLFGFYLLFIQPFFMVRAYFQDLKLSLCLAYSFIFSFSFCWLLFFFSFIFKLNGSILLVAILFIYAVLYYLFKTIKKRRQAPSITQINIGYIIVLLLSLLPILVRTGEIFTKWDAVVSWNRWALELYDNYYNPMSSEYPILFPSLWSLLYKIQGSSQIWFTVKTTLFLAPTYLITILLSLYQETKNKIFLFICVFIFPYYLTADIVSGYMDVPVMIIGLLSLTMLKAFELSQSESERIKYLSCALLIAGVSSITKQSGIVFVAFCIIYIQLFAWKIIKHKRILLIVFLIASMFFVSFLFFFKMYEHDPFSHTPYLMSLSFKRNILGFNLFQILSNLSMRFFIHPMMRIPVIFLFLAACFSTKKDFRKKEPLSFLCFIFFLLGVLYWIFFCSYDYRNSLWTKSLLILSGSNMLSYGFKNILNKSIILAPKLESFFQNFHLKFNKKTYFRGFSLIILVLVFLFVESSNIDNFLIDHQNHQQIKLGHPKLAQLIVRLLENEPDCVIVVTNDQTTKYNYFCRRFFSRIKQTGGSLLDYKEDFYKKANSCPYGYFWISLTPDRDIFTQIVDLEKQKLIVRINSEYFIYYVPPPGF